ncbi:MAG: uroporphyrinogen decarboxylase family protein [Methanomassiliicoccales archaeon]|jgi:uroporphyrinogen decarboxylase
MRPFELVLRTVQFKPTDRVPVIPQIFGHAALCNQVPLSKYLKDGRVLADCQIRAAERYRSDAVFGLMDVNVECEALGSELVYRENNYPYIKSAPLREGSWKKELEVPDPLKDGRLPELLESIRIMRKELDGKVLVTSCILGPFTLLGQLLGIDRAMYMINDDREQFVEHLKFAAEVGKICGTAQVKAGSQVPIVFDPSATQMMLTPVLFKELEVPVLRDLFGSLRAAGALGTWLHIAGQTTKILPNYADLGVTVGNFDSEVTPQGAINALPKTCLDGNIRTLSFIIDSPETIKRESLDLISVFANRGGFILSSGCEIPLEAKPECINAMVTAAKGD